MKKHLYAVRVFTGKSSEQPVLETNQEAFTTAGAIIQALTVCPTEHLIIEKIEVVFIK
jgi:acetolactate synthase small subunit